MSFLTRLLPAALVAASTAQAETYNGYEMPSYAVEAVVGAVEIRAYAPMIVAEVTVDGARRLALSRGFRILAGYIFGGNTARGVAVTQSQKIDMTVPVAQAPGGEGRWVVSFMMPSDWELDTLPTPDNNAVRLTRTAPERLAVMTFSGTTNGARLAEVEARLLAVLASAGIEARGPARHAYYNDPMTLPWARRNEVMVPVE